MENRIYGYARVSSKGQNLDRQLEALRAYGIGEREIVTDKASGKDFNRTGYIALKETMLRTGDILVIKELDRLGRDMEQMKKEWNNLVKNGIDIIILDTPILNTTNKTDLEKTLISSIVFDLLSYLAEKERLKNKQRREEGIAVLKSKNDGKGIGRPSAEYPKEFKAVYGKWKSKEITAVNAMDQLGLKKNTFYKLVKEHEEGKQ